jgi:hypothetical protein
VRLKHLWTVLGLGMVAWGAWGLVTSTSTRSLLHTGRFFVVGLAAHDGAFAPAAFAAGVLISRFVPRVVRTPVRVGLALAAVLTMLALPLILSTNRLRSPSVLPRDYERNLLVLLGLVAAGVVVSGLCAVIRQRRAATPSPAP